MRFKALAAGILVLAACTKKDSATADSSAMDSVAAAEPVTSLASFAAVWDVTAKPEGKDSVATTYVLNTTDTTDWTFAFPGGKPIHMRVTGIKGDTVLTQTDVFESSVRKGLKAQTTGVSWIQDGKMVGKITAHYQVTDADSVRVFDTEGIRKY
ncbi:MAG TPA: hypothetical protein VJL35_12355 [Gemmatimonadaceae bacterium]|nr:hypothetical protein [Gemmatimonadaceae bacterium]